MRKESTLLFILLFAFAVVVPVAGYGAGLVSRPEARLLSPGRAFFVPHWYVKAQAGGAYDVGEATFTQLVSPALQLSAGYQFDEFVALRGSLSGLWARNRYVWPAVNYKWCFLQPMLETELNLTSLVLGSNPERLTRAYAFLGGGVVYSWGNDEAEQTSRLYGAGMEKLWSGFCWHVAVRAGLGLDYAVTPQIAIGAEVSATMLPDHFNSKRGSADNRDWHFNALVGVKFTIGRSHGRTFKKTIITS